MRYDSEHKARTRTRVLAEAAAMIRAEGPDRLGVAAVMSRAGLTHGGFYAHFASRDDLLAGAVGYMLDERYAAFFAEADEAEPHAALANFIDRYLSIRHVNRRELACPLPILSGDLPHLPTAARDRFVAGVNLLVTSVLALAHRTGATATRAEASSAIAEMVGTVAIAQALPDEGAAAELLESARVSVYRKLGIAPPPR